MGYMGRIKLSTTLPTNYLLSALCTLYSVLSSQTSKKTTPLISAQFLVRRVADTTLGEFGVDGLYLDVLPIGDIIR